MPTRTLEILRSAFVEQAVVRHPWHDTLRTAVDRVRAASPEVERLGMLPELTPEPATAPAPGSVLPG